MEKIKSNQNYKSKTLNTNGRCFLCFRNDPLLMNYLSLKHLCSILDIDVNKIFQTCQSGNDLEKAEALCSVCEKCEKIFTRLSNLCQFLDVIKMEVDYRLKEIYTIGEDANQDSELAQDYRRQIAMERESLLHIPIVDKLRSSILTNARSTKISDRQPQVRVESLGIMPEPVVESNYKDEVQIEEEREDEEPELYLEEEAFEETYNDLKSTAVDPLATEADIEEGHFASTQKESELNVQISDVFSLQAEDKNKLNLQVGSASFRISDEDVSLDNFEKVMISGKPHFHCIHCLNKPYSNIGAAKRHYKVTHLGYRLRCDYCNKTFTNNRSKQTHQGICVKRMGTGDVIELPLPRFKCPVENCGKMFRWQGQVHNHTKQYHK